MSVDRSTSQAHCTVLLTRSAVQGQAFALALAEQLAEEPTAEHTVRGPGECRVLFAPLQQARTVPRHPGARAVAAGDCHRCVRMGELHER